MLPASLYMPKEALPLVDTPLINHLIWEAVRAGVERVHLILSERKAELLDDFLGDSPVYGIEVRPDLPRSSLTPQIEGVEIKIHIQHRPRGVGDAISIALHHIDGAFLVLLGDNLLIKKHRDPAQSGPEHASEASLELVNRFEKTGLPCAGVYLVAEEEVRKYGVVALEGGHIESIVEKPEPLESPSQFVLCGRYLFPGNTSDILNLYPDNEYGELQSIALLDHLIENGGLEAVRLEGYEMYDSGDPMTWLKSQVDHALRRDDMGGHLEDWLRHRLE